MLRNASTGRSSMAEIQELDDLTKAEIQRHRDCMTDLAKRSIAAKQRWNAQIPFTLLPEELVAYIFLLACSQDDRPSAPLRIGSICHDWRTIAWSASELWSSVTVCLEVQEEAAEIQSDLLESWLLRAKERPVSIVVTHRDEDEDEWESIPSQALDLVLAYSEQWRYVDLDIPWRWIYHLDCLHKVHGKIPLLEGLTIQGTLRDNLEVFSVAPRLRSVVFKLAYCESKNLCQISLPWSQLTELSIISEDIQPCLVVVERCSSLAHLALHENVFSYQQSKPSGPITINITSLHITSNAGDSWFMDSISAPHLKDLAVHSLRGGSHVLCSLYALIVRSGCADSITRFSFDGYIPSTEAMIWFLSILHNLSELELHNDEHAPSFNNAFINALHSPSTLSGSTRRYLLPNLISFRYLGPITFHSDGFMDILKEVKYI